MHRICYNKLRTRRELFTCFSCHISLVLWITERMRRVLVCSEHPLRVLILPHTVFFHRTGIGNPLMKRDRVHGLTEFIVSVFIGIFLLSLYHYLKQNFLWVPEGISQWMSLSISSLIGLQIFLQCLLLSSCSNTTCLIKFEWKVSI